MSLPNATDLFLWMDARFAQPAKHYCDFPITKASTVRVKDMASGKVEEEVGAQLIPKYLPMVEILQHIANLAYVMNSNLPHCKLKKNMFELLDTVAEVTVKAFRIGDDDAKTN